MHRVVIFMKEQTDTIIFRKVFYLENSLFAYLKTIFSVNNVGRSHYFMQALSPL